MPSECDLCADLGEPGSPLCDECGQCKVYDCTCVHQGKTLEEYGLVVDDFPLGEACNIEDDTCESCQ